MTVYLVASTARIPLDIAHGPQGRRIGNNNGKKRYRLWLVMPQKMMQTSLQ